MVRLLAGAIQHHIPHRVSASVCGSACIYHGHHRRLALWDWLVDNRSGTTAAQSADGLLTTARPLWLYESCSYLPRHRYAVAPHLTVVWCACNENRGPGILPLGTFPN